MTAKRKYYPGDLRIIGEKEYAVILSKLMSYTKQIDRENKPDVLNKIVEKIIEKLTELGFKKEARQIIQFLKAPNNLYKKTDSIIKISLLAWDTGKEKHELAKINKKRN
jgi:vacuolar-type H+-ATPase subunit E/Vma4